MSDLAGIVELARCEEAHPMERQEAFAELVERFQDMAYGYAYAILSNRQAAEDAAQEAFVTAYRYLDQLEDAEAFPGWFRRIVFSRCHRLIRSAGRPSEPLSDEMAPATPNPGPPTLVERAELRAQILAAVQSLPEAQRLATVLYYIDGYSQSEVADFLEVPVTAVKKRLQRARDGLRERMIDMVRDNLQAERPSNDDEFVRSVKLSLTLEMAALDSQMSVLEMLLVDGLDPNTQNREGQTLLHWAAQQGHLDAVELLLKNGADPRIADRSGKTPLDWAVEKGHREVARLLRKSARAGDEGA